MKKNTFIFLGAIMFGLSLFAMTVMEIVAADSAPSLTQMPDSGVCSKGLDSNMGIFGPIYENDSACMGSDTLICKRRGVYLGNSQDGEETNLWYYQQEGVLVITIENEEMETIVRKEYQPIGEGNKLYITAESGVMKHHLCFISSEKNWFAEYELVPQPVHP